jgi:hypothetical protein
MPIYRAYFATSAEARTKASAGIDLLNARAAEGRAGRGQRSARRLRRPCSSRRGVDRLPALAVPVG